MNKMGLKVLDLFCGAGGAAKGISQTKSKEIEIMGIDIIPQPEYPFYFEKGDVMQILNDSAKGWDFIWASPPCQAYSEGGNKESRKKYPKLIEPLREMLLKTGAPFVIENVPKAPLRKDLMLCGEMFGLKIIRHRIFEIHGFKCAQPKHLKHKGKVSTGEYQGVYTGGRCGCFGNKELRNKLKVGTIKQWQNAMGITHITDRKAIAESVPPAYSQYIFSQFLHRNFKG